MKIATIFDYLERDTICRLNKHHNKYYILNDDTVEKIQNEGQITFLFKI